MEKTADTLKLYKPITIDDKQVTDLPYDFDKITGVQIQNAKKMLERGHITLAAETDGELHAAIFAIAAGLDYADLLRMHGKDYIAAGLMVRNFFFLDAEEIQESGT